MNYPPFDRQEYWGAERWKIWSSWRPLEGEILSKVKSTLKEQDSCKKETKSWWCHSSFWIWVPGSSSTFGFSFFWANIFLLLVQANLNWISALCNSKGLDPYNYGRCGVPGAGEGRAWEGTNMNCLSYGRHCARGFAYIISLNHCNRWIIFSFYTFGKWGYGRWSHTGWFNKHFILG